MKKKLKYLFIFIICITMFTNLSSAILYILNYMGLDITKFDYIDQTYYSTLMEIIYLFVLVLLYRKCLKKDLILFKLNKKDYINKIINYFIIFITIKFTSSIIESFISILLGRNLNTSINQNTIEILFKKSPLVMAIDCIILAPFVEECIFRLGLKKIINNKYIFITTSGSLFGLMHIFPTNLPYSIALVQSITYVTMGLTLATIYDKTNNIWVSITVHILNNFIGIISLLALL